MGAWRRTDFPFTLRAAKRSEGTSGEAGLYVGEKGRSSRTGPERIGFNFGVAPGPVKPAECAT